MVTPNHTTETTTEDNNKAPEERGLPIRTQIAEKLTSISPSVSDAVVEAMVERTKKKYVDAFVICLDKLTTMEKDLAKIRPDQTSFNVKGEKLSETFSKNKLDERNKLNEQVNKLIRIMDKALDKGEWNDMCNYSTQGQNKSGNNEKDQD